LAADAVSCEADAADFFFIADAAMLLILGVRGN